MPSCSRREVVIPGEIGVYHCHNRCVQRAWLCGQDPATGMDYEHRRDVIEQVERQLASLFAIDVGFHAEMSNHLQLILRSRPDLAAVYSEIEVVRRWWIISRLKRRGECEIAPPTPEELERECKSPERIAKLRQRLADDSWFMGALCEHLSRRFNQESGTSGAFWEHRFECSALQTESAILICGIYVDLNPIRAAEALTPEEAVHTSAYNRIQARCEPQEPTNLQDDTHAAESLEEVHASSATSVDSDGAATSPSPSSDGWGRLVGARPDEWLCPLTLCESDPAQRAGTPSQLPSRASDKGLLSISLDAYLELLHWTGRQVREGSSGVIPATLAPILDRLGIRSECWLESVRQFTHQFGYVIGKLGDVLAHAQRVGRQWFRGQSRCAAVFS